jgi:hypothetical protein
MPPHPFFGGTMLDFIFANIKYIIPAFFFCVLAFFWSFYIKRVRRILALTPKPEWPRVPGKVVSSQVYSEVRTDSDGSATFYGADVHFAYEFQGKTQLVKSRDVDSYGSTLKGGAEKLVAQYSVGQSVTMLVPVAEPEMSLPEGFPRKGDKLTLVIGAIVLLGNSIGMPLAYYFVFWRT